MPSCNGCLVQNFQIIIAEILINFEHLVRVSNWETFSLNLLTPNVNYNGRTAPLTSKVAFYIFIQQI